MSLILDTGALIAYERGDRDVAVLMSRAADRKETLITSSGCVAQAWRTGGPRQARLSRLLAGVDEEALSPDNSQRIGELCAAAGVSDIVDAHVVRLARQGDTIVTSDPADIRQLVQARNIEVIVEIC